MKEFPRAYFESNLEPEPIQDSPEKEPIEEAVDRLRDLYVQASLRFLERDDPLRDRIIDYYCDRPQTHDEFVSVVKNKGDRLDEYISSVESFTNDETQFVEKMQKFFQLRDTRADRRRLDENPPLTTDDEYELGVYADALEPQVRDAVFLAHRKGYKTFQSGFAERSDRNQFLDVYNRNVFISDDTRRNIFEKYFVKIKVENFNDRTTITLIPETSDPVRLTEWKTIWDDLVSQLPEADPELVADQKITGEHNEFRKIQDKLRAELN